MHSFNSRPMGVIFIIALVAIMVSGFVLLSFFFYAITKLCQAINRFIENLDVSHVPPPKISLSSPAKPEVRGIPVLVSCQDEQLRSSGDFRVEEFLRSVDAVEAGFSVGPYGMLFYKESICGELVYLASGSVKLVFFLTSAEEAMHECVRKSLQLPANGALEC